MEGVLGIKGTAATNASGLMENSHVFMLDRVTTPVMIQSGGADASVQPFASEEVFIGLKRLGKEAVYLKYAGEDHVIQGAANLRDFWGRVTQWFDGYLKVKTVQ